MAAAETYPDDLKYHREHDWARVEGDEAVVGRQQDHEPLFENRQLVECFRKLAGNSDDRDLEVAPFEHLDHLRTSRVDDLDLDVGMLRAELDQQL